MRRDRPGWMVGLTDGRMGSLSTSTVKLPVAAEDVDVSRDEAVNPGEVSDDMGGDDSLEHGIDHLQDREGQGEGESDTERVKKDGPRENHDRPIAIDGPGRTTRVCRGLFRWSGGLMRRTRRRAGGGGGAACSRVGD